MAPSSPALIKWLVRLLAGGSDEGPLSRLELMHVIEGQHADRLQLWRLSTDKRYDASELAQEIWDSADSDLNSRDSGQPQRYVVYAYRDPEAELPEAQHAFQRRSALDVGRRGADSEPPTHAGLVAHYMRHDENVHRIVLGASEALVGKLTDDLERERAGRIKAEELIWSMNERFQKLLDREHERRLEEAKELAKAKRIDELMGLASALVPIVVARLAGSAATQAASKPQLPSPTEPQQSPQDAAVRSFFTGLSEEEVAGVMGSLASTNQIALAELYRDFTSGPQHPADSAARQLAIRKFLKCLSEDEVRNIFASLTDRNRAQLFALYSQYRDIELAEQERKPEILRS